MRKIAAATLGWLMLAVPALAARDVGDSAPLFTAPASLAGEAYTFSLADALAKGPVVLYFYPKAFTEGCTIEAHEFSEAVEKHAALGATVIGVSGDSIDTLKKFSVSECRGKFPVAADVDHAIMKSYDAVLIPGLGIAKRISFVIAPDARILYVYSDLNPHKHVQNTLAAVQAYRSRSK